MLFVESNHMTKQILALFLVWFFSQSILASDKQKELIAAFNNYAQATPYERVGLFSQKALTTTFNSLLVQKTDEQKLKKVSSIVANINYIDFFSVVEGSVKALESQNAVTLIAISNEHNRSKKLTYFFVRNPNSGWLIDKAKNEIIGYPYQQKNK